MSQWCYRLSSKHIEVIEVYHRNLPTNKTLVVSFFFFFAFKAFDALRGGGQESDQEGEGH